MIGNQFIVASPEKRIPLFITNSCSHVTYKSTSVYNSLGLNEVPFSTYVSTYMKAWLAISTEANIVDFIMSEKANEFSYNQ